MTEIKQVPAGFELSTKDVTGEEQLPWEVTLKEWLSRPRAWDGALRVMSLNEWRPTFGGSEDAGNEYQRRLVEHAIPLVSDQHALIADGTDGDEVIARAKKYHRHQVRRALKEQLPVPDAVRNEYECLVEVRREGVASAYPGRRVARRNNGFSHTLLCAF